MPIQCSCPECGYRFKVADELAGKSVLCPECQTHIKLKEIPFEFGEVLPVEPPALDVSASHAGNPPNPWHYGRNGKQFGPVSASEVQSAITRGEIRSSDLVWRQGLPSWERASKHFAFPRDPGRVTYNRKNDTFVGSLPAVMKLAVKAVHRLGYRIANANESLGILSFQVGTTFTRYGGQYSLSVEEIRENTYRIRVEGFQTEGGWGTIFNNTCWTPQEAERVVNEMCELAD